VTEIKPRQSNQLRIIAGQWRGQKLNFPDLPGLRPASDRIRETQFNWLQAEIIGAKCLDLFAGSGALGLEALSRNADSVVFVDSSKNAIDSIRENLSKLHSEQAQLFCQQAKLYVTSSQPLKFDIIFLDPPFDSNLLNPSITALQQGSCLRKGSLIYLEHEKNSHINLPKNWVLLKSKKSGNVKYGLCEVIE